MKRAIDLIPWKVTDVSIRPYKQMWAFNPSIHFDGATWRCVVRCSDYAMPDGVTIRSPRAEPGEAQTKNAMVIFDPDRWRPIEIYKMRERDDAPRASADSVGFEDIRLFKTDRGLQGIAASLHLARTDYKKPLAEQVLLSFDDRYDIVEARPIRGVWSDSPQKNWVPYDHCAEPRFLYAIDRGILFDDRGGVDTSEALVRPAMSSRSTRHEPDRQVWERARDRADDERDRATEDRQRSRRDRKSRDDEPLHVAAAPQGVAAHVGLRGGTQLVRIGDDAWLGLGHAMKFVADKKFYWHVLYVVDSRGKMTSASEPLKLAENGIEFAAGLAIDGDRVVVSFGVDDMECRIGETRLPAVLSVLRPVDQVVR